MCSEDGRDLAFFLYLQLRECGGTPPQQITIFCSEGWKQPCAQSSVPSAQCSELLSFYICSSESVVGHHHSRSQTCNSLGCIPCAQSSVPSAQSCFLFISAAQREEIGQQHLQLAQSTFKESCLHFGVTSCILNTLNLEMGIRTQHAPQAVCNVCNHYK